MRQNGGAIMKKEKRDWIAALFREIQSDPGYAALAVEYDKFHDQFERLANELSVEEQDILWGFVCVSEEMNWRMLEWVGEKYKINP